MFHYFAIIISITQGIQVADNGTENIGTTFQFTSTEAYLDRSHFCSVWDLSEWNNTFVVDGIHLGDFANKIVIKHSSIACMDTIIPESELKELNWSLGNCTYADDTLLQRNMGTELDITSYMRYRCQGTTKCDLIRNSTLSDIRSQKNGTCLDTPKYLRLKVKYYLTIENITFCKVETSRSLNLGSTTVCVERTSENGSWTDVRQHCLENGGDFSYMPTAPEWWRSSIYACYSNLGTFWLKGYNDELTDPNPNPEETLAPNLWAYCNENMSCQSNVTLDGVNRNGFCIYPAYPEKHQCPNTTKGGITWESTHPGEIRQQLCPNSSSTYMTLECGLNGTWSEHPDTSNCTCPSSLLHDFMWWNATHYGQLNIQLCPNSSDYMSWKCDWNGTWIGSPDTTNCTCFKTTWDNMTFDAVQIGETMMAKCPGYSSANATWHCNWNGTWEGDVPNTDNCKCPNVTWHNITFEEIHIGETRVMPCPGDPSNCATWFCAMDGSWEGTPNISNCTCYKKAWENMTFEAIRLGETRIKKCPGNSSENATWHCNWNGIWERDNPNIDNCTCPDTTSTEGNLLWNAIRIGLNRTEPCPHPSSENRTWLCGWDGHWTGEPDTSNCTCKATFWKGTRWWWNETHYGQLNTQLCPNSIKDYMSWQCGINGTWIRSPDTINCTCSKTTWENMTFDEVHVGDTVMTKCPGNSSDNATWHCNTNGTWEGDIPNTDNCKCPNITWHNIAFEEIHIGETRVIPCPGDPSNSATWFCAMDGAWEGTPNISNCTCSKKTWENMTFEAIRIGETRIIKCPGNSSENATWHCNWNGTWEGDNPNIDNCTCPDTTSTQGDLLWNAVRIGLNRTEPCPHPPSENRTWLCGWDGYWTGEPDTSNCTCNSTFWSGTRWWWNGTHYGQLNTQLCPNSSKDYMSWQCGINGTWIGSPDTINCTCSKTTWESMTFDEVHVGDTVMTKCPGNSSDNATWHCNTNGTWEGIPNITNCKCPNETWHNMTFEEIQIGKTRAIPCPGDSSNNATWLCTMYGAWDSTPNISHCKCNRTVNKVTWKATQIGTTDVEQCPNSQFNRSWDCGWDGHWVGQPNTSYCKCNQSFTFDTELNETQIGDLLNTKCPYSSDTDYNTTSWNCAVNGVWKTYPDLRNCTEYGTNWNKYLAHKEDVYSLCNNVTDMEITFKAVDIVFSMEAVNKSLISWENKTEYNMQSAKEVFNSTVCLSSTTVKYTSAWWTTILNRKQRASEFFSLVDESINRATTINISGSYNFSEIIIDVHNRVLPSDTKEVKVEYNGTGGSFIVLPKEALEIGTVNGSWMASYTTFMTVHDILGEKPLLMLGQARKNSTVKIVNTRVVGTIIGQHSAGVQLSRDIVTVQLRHLYEPSVYYISNPTCVFWDIDIHDWNPRGCWVIKFTDLYTVCGCDHLTNIGVLVDYGGIIDKNNTFEPVISIVTTFGCCVSVVCLSLSLVIFFTLRRLEKIRIFIHGNLCFSLLVAQLILLIGLDATGNTTLCRLIAVMIHYFYLASFLWMFVEGYQLYVKVVVVFEKYPPRMRFLMGFAYGLPGVIILVSAFARWDGYGTSTYCWFSKESGLIWTFMGPMAIVIMCNMYFLITAVHKSHRAVSSSRNAKMSVKTSLWLKGIASLTVTLGLTWSIGFLFFHQQVEILTDILEFSFAVCNSLQGACLFLFHCVLNTEIREQALKKLIYPYERPFFPCRKSVRTATRMCPIRLRPKNVAAASVNHDDKVILSKMR